MEFSPRGFQRTEAPKPTFNANKDASVVGGGSPSPTDPGKRSPFKRGTDKIRSNKIVAALFVILFASAVVLFIALIFGISIGGKEARNVDGSNYQTVVMADGQAYFGKIGEITKDYISLGDVFYLQGQDLENGNTSQTAARLVKLGCEIHGPQDRMFIYRNQVSYWENLTEGGRVTAAINQFKEENPDGQTCPTTATTPTAPTAPTTPGAGAGAGADTSEAGADSTAPAGAPEADNSDTPTPTDPTDTPTP